MSIDKKMDGLEESFHGRIFTSPPDVGIFRLFVFPLTAPRGSLGALATHSASSMGIRVAFAPSLTLGTSVGCQVVVCVPVVRPGELGPVCEGLVLRGCGGRSLYVRGAETQDGAETSPTLFTLSLDGAGDRLLHIVPTGQQQVHKVHIGPRDKSRGRK